MKSKKRIWRVAAALLCLLMIGGALVACKKKQDEQPTEPPADTEIPMVDFFEGNPGEYKIIYASKAGSATKKAVEALVAAINTAYGTDIKSYTDAKYSAEESTKEILIGDTNRQESTDAKARCAEDNDFVIQQVGTRLVLVGGKQDGTVRAVRYLLDHYIAGNSNTTLMLDVGLNLEWKYKEQCAILFNMASAYKVVYDDKNATTKAYAKEFVEEIKSLTGVDMTLEEDYKKSMTSLKKDFVSDQMEILIGESDRLESNQGEALGYMDYEIRLTDNKVVLRGGSNEALRRAVLSFSESLEKGLITNLTDASQSRTVSFSSGNGGILQTYDSFTPAWASSYTAPTWADDLDEKLVALTTITARNMSASYGGDGVNYPVYSDLALASAMKAGADVLVLNARETRDGVLVVFPSSDLSMYTNVNSKRGVNGNPMDTLLNEWSYEELQQLNFTQNGKVVSNAKILTLYEAVALCKDRCLMMVNIDGKDENQVDSIMADLLQIHGAYTSYFKPDPHGQVITQSVIMDFFDTYAGKGHTNATVAKEVYRQMLFDADGNQLENRCVRKLYTNKDGDTAAVWNELREEWRTFLYTDTIVEYCKYHSGAGSAITTPDTLNYEQIYSLDKNDLKGRVMVFSDPHFAYKNNNLEEDSVIGDTANQKKNAEKRVGVIADMIKAEADGRGLDAVAILGDLGTDDAGWQSTEYYKTFYNLLKSKLNTMGLGSLPIKVLPGNHDSVTNEAWNTAFGTDRQHSFVVGTGDNQKLFLMVDSFSETASPTDPGSGGPYMSNVDENWINDVKTWIKSQLDANPNIQDVILCSHYLTSSDYNSISAAFPKIKVFFQGHTHQYDVWKTNSGAYYIDEGGFSYTALGPPWTFEYLDLSTLWGYQIVEWTDTQMVTYHEFIAYKYYASNMYCVLNQNVKTTDIVLSKKES